MNTEPISQLVLVGVPDTRITAAVRRRISRLKPGGVVLFRRNMGTTEEVARLNRALREILGPAAILAVDQEGGRVARLRPPFTLWPPMRAFGETGSSSLVRRAGRAMGRELAAAGFNCDFAPVLDVDSNPANPVIGDRSFGSEPRIVGRLGLAFARGLEDAGILPCGKHFPGHGDTALDSHHELPTVDRTARELRRVELAPFRRAIRVGLPLLMSAHVRYPALDPELPATLSRPILQGLLRDRLGFRGIVVSDDLAMHALDAVGPLEEVAPLAVAAGCDLLLACQSLDAGETAVAALRNAVRSRRIPARRVAEALRRVSRLRAVLARREPTRPSLDDVLRSGEASRVLRDLERRRGG